MYNIAELGALGMAIFVALVISLKFLIGLIHKQHPSASSTGPVEPSGLVVQTALPEIGVASPLQHRETQ